MSFLDKPLSQMSQADIERLIDQRIAAAVRPTPKQVANLSDLDIPMVRPDVANDGEALYFNVATGQYESSLVDAKNLKPTIVLATEFIAGDPNAAHMELGVSPDNPADLGLRSFDANSDNTFKLDGEDGSVYMKGRLDFGTASRLLQNDIMEIATQIPSGFQVPARVQSANVTSDQGGPNLGQHLDITWDAPTSPGSCLLMVVSQANGGPNVPTTPTVSGWTQIQTASCATSSGHMRQTLFKIENAATRAGAETIDFTATTNTAYCNARMYEYSGVSVRDLLPAAATGSAGAVASTATGTLTQAGELVFGAFCAAGDTTGIYTSIGSAGRSTATHIGGHPAQAITDLDTRAFELITTSTSSVQITGTAQDAWIAQIVTFEAAGATGSVDAPDAGVTRLYAQENGAGTPLLHQADVTGALASLALAPQGQGYRFEVVTTSFNIASVAAQSTSSQSVTIAGLNVGDICAWLGADTNGKLLIRTSPVCSSGGSITLFVANNDTAAHAMSGANHTFLVIHKS